MFIDFIKMTSLFISKEIDPKSYLYLLAQIFRLLSKKKHSRFLFFLKIFFYKKKKKKKNELVFRRERKFRF